MTKNALTHSAFTNPLAYQKGTGVLCPALIISAPSSGSGKTTVTAALARYHRNQGKKVTVFKVGPDFIDPMILRQASGELVYQLDLWLVGEKDCRELLFSAAKESDLILIEGVMGLFDGTPSSADIAQYFNIPVLGVIDASAMAQTFAAVTFGLANYRKGLPFAGVIANRVNTPRHMEILATALQPELSSELSEEQSSAPTFFGRIPKDADITLPERHLGLVQAQELADIDQQLDKAASHIANTKLVDLPAAVEFFTEHPVKFDGDDEKALANTRIAIVKDKAFSFIYEANIAFLKQSGAEIIYCSALNDECLPDCDVLYLPGGYPELYAVQLVENTGFIQSLKAFANANKPIIAECGGMLYLLDELTDLNQQKLTMAGLLPGTAAMQKKLAAIGSQYADIALFNLAKNNDDTQNIMRGHSFHYSSAEIKLAPISQTIHHPSKRLGEYIYQHGNIIASYMHWYLPSNPALAIKLFDKNRRL
ncbi:MAG: cobyrinate a,c-diamide synthase [Thalassotalea sp.]